eukprot:comp7034_c0_seq1/m.2770 comp7034_c0_seq1/g.2770  ORF comp7034_c0_seq1/g.2770 comp7034_c0_seq1/m.2770 type:complete len:659 (-) comp7034_c0_seq1:307-2283(-)
MHMSEVEAGTMPAATFRCSCRPKVVAIDVIKGRAFDAATVSKALSVSIKAGKKKYKTRNAKSASDGESVEWNESYRAAVGVKDEWLYVKVKTKGGKTVGQADLSFSDLSCQPPNEPTWMLLKTPSGEQAMCGEVLLKTWVAEPRDGPCPTRTSQDNESISSSPSTTQLPKLPSKRSFTLQLPTFSRTHRATPIPQEAAGCGEDQGDVLDSSAPASLGGFAQANSDAGTSSYQSYGSDENVDRLIGPSDEVEGEESVPEPPVAVLTAKSIEKEFSEARQQRLDSAFFAAVKYARQQEGDQVQRRESFGQGSEAEANVQKAELEYRKSLVRMASHGASKVSLLEQHPKHVEQPKLVEPRLAVERQKNHISAGSRMSLYLQTSFTHKCDKPESRQKQTRCVACLLEQHSASITKLRDLVGGCAPPHLHDDLSLLRYILSFKTPEAAQMPLLRMISWRAANKDLVDGAWAGRETPAHATVGRFMAAGVHGFAREGGPVHITRIGVSNLSGLMDSVSDHDMLQWFMYEKQKAYMMCDRITRETGLLTKQVSLLDFAEVKLWSVREKRFEKVLAESSKQGEDLYPQLVDATFVVNAPKMITVAGSFLSKILPKRMVEKVVVCEETAEGTVPSKLAPKVGPDQLPPWVGGNCRCPGGCVAFRPHA